MDLISESEQRLRAAFNNAALGIVEADSEDRFLAVNDRICRVGTRDNPFLPVHVDAVVDRALIDLRKSVEESGAVITKEALPVVTGDEMQLRQPRFGLLLLSRSQLC